MKVVVTPQEDDREPSATAPNTVLEIGLSRENGAMIAVIIAASVGSTRAETTWDD